MAKEPQIDPSQPIPIYFQLKTLLLEDILGGRYDGDGRLPTEHELCERYRISRTPVTRALSELAEEGVVLRHRRRGTFVNPHWRRPRADSRRCASSSPKDRGAGCSATRRPAAADQSRHGAAPVAAAGADALGRRGAGARPRDPRLGVGVRVRRRGLPPADRGDRLRLAAGDGARLPAAARRANRYGGQTYGVSAFADVAGLWYRRRSSSAQASPRRRRGASCGASGVRSPRPVRHVRS
jgi:DNA-binding transcriptional regulator YhcF (GntR family)